MQVERDRRAREARRARFMGNIEQAKASIAKHGLMGLYPGLSKPTPDQSRSGIPIGIPATWIKRVCEKIVRGHVYIADRLFIEPPFAVSFYALDDAGASPLREMLAKHGEVFSRGEALLLKRATVRASGLHAVYEVVLWGQFTMYASVSNAEGNESQRPQALT